MKDRQLLPKKAAPSLPAAAKTCEPSPGAQRAEIEAAEDLGPTGFGDWQKGGAVLILAPPFSPQLPEAKEMMELAGQECAISADRSNRDHGAPRIGPPLSPAGGAAIYGVDLSQPLSAALKDQILDAFRKHHIVVFHDQRLTREQQFAFAASLGEVEGPAPHKARGKRHNVAHVISNLDGDGNPIDRSSSPVSNYRWHTDKSYHRTPPMMTMLHAIEVPPRGGDTEFANTAMAYLALPVETKRRIAELRVVFYWGAARGPDDDLPLGRAESEASQPVDHPLVRTHPDTGEMALYLGNHASHILGLPLAESAALLDELLAHATQRRFVYAHHWREGDLVMWDNRCLLHRAVANFETTRDRRILYRTVMKGTVPY